MAEKFLVISYDNDEQQTFWDEVVAANEEKAKEFVETCRSYALVVEVFSVPNLRDATNRLHKQTPKQLGMAMKKLVDDYMGRDLYDHEGATQ